MIQSEIGQQNITKNECILKDRINRLKRKLRHDEPKTKEDITMDFLSSVKCLNEDFVLHIEEDKSVIIFATDSSLRRLFSTTDWMADGTFKVVPALYLQLFTIFGNFYGLYTPLMFALLSDKKQKTYSKLFKALIDRANDKFIDVPNGVNIHLDFEVASSNAFMEWFPNGSVSRCLFHLSQSIWRQIQDYGLSSKYESDEHFRDKIRYLPALSFLKAEQVASVFKEMYSTADDKVKIIYDYFNATYIAGRVKYITRGGVEVRDLPTFPVPSWNSRERTISNLSRTNNKQEGWHNRLRIVCASSHIAF